MAGQSNAAPILIRRKKVVAAAGHHGGAWKVAYADFVTAMMAFFLLMWLLGATTEKQRKGLADYFNPSIPVNRISGGGEGAFGGDNIFTEETLAQSGTGGAQRLPDRNAADATEARSEEAALRAVAQELAARSGENAEIDLALQQVVTRMTSEGLVIELFDRPGSALFEPDSAIPRELLRVLMGVVAEVAGKVTNDIAVAGHVRAYPVTLREPPAWPLSAARAQAARGLAEAAGVAPQRVQRVTGFADRRPATPDPAAARNNRVEIVLLRREAGHD